MGKVKERLLASRERKRQYEAAKQLGKGKSFEERKALLKEAKAGTLVDKPGTTSKGVVYSGAGATQQQRQEFLKQQTRLQKQAEAQKFYKKAGRYGSVEFYQHQESIKQRVSQQKARDIVASGKGKIVIKAETLLQQQRKTFAGTKKIESRQQELQQQSAIKRAVAIEKQRQAFEKDVSQRYNIFQYETELGRPKQAKEFFREYEPGFFQKATQQLKFKSQTSKGFKQTAYQYGATISGGIASSLSSSRKAEEFARAGFFYPKATKLKAASLIVAGLSKSEERKTFIRSTLKQPTLKETEFAVKKQYGVVRRGVKFAIREPYKAAGSVLGTATLYGAASYGASKLFGLGQKPQYIKRSARGFKIKGTTIGGKRIIAGKPIEPKVSIVTKKPKLPLYIRARSETTLYAKGFGEKAFIQKQRARFFLPKKQASESLKRQFVRSSAKTKSLYSQPKMIIDLKKPGKKMDLFSSGFKSYDGVLIEKVKAPKGLIMVEEIKVSFTGAAYKKPLAARIKEKITVKPFSSKKGTAAFPTLAPPEQKLIQVTGKRATIGYEKIAGSSGVLKGALVVVPTSKILSSSKTKTILDTASLTKSKQIPLAASSLGQSSRIVLAQKQAVKSKIRVPLISKAITKSEKFPASFKFTTGFGKIKTKPVPIPVPIPKFKIRDYKRRKEELIKKITFNRAFSYTPTLRASTFKIYGKAPKTITGFEERPLIKGV